MPLAQALHQHRFTLAAGDAHGLEPDRRVERVIAQIAGMDAKLEEMRGDLAPLGELAEKIPGIGR